MRLTEASWLDSTNHQSSLKPSLSFGVKCVHPPKTWPFLTLSAGDDLACSPMISSESSHFLSTDRSFWRQSRRLSREPPPRQWRLVACASWTETLGPSSPPILRLSPRLWLNHLDTGWSDFRWRQSNAAPHVIEYTLLEMREDLPVKCGSTVVQ